MAVGRFALTANTDEPDPEARFDVVYGASRRVDYETAQINSFGSAGRTHPWC